jgi:prolipoprotein diacylglyceryltransferase
MILAGTERFFIEKIRVISTYDKFGIHATQAEIIAVVLFIGGILLIAASYNSYNKSRQNQANTE